MFRKCIKLFLFWGILVGIICATFRYCKIKDNVCSNDVFETFYGLPEDSIDVILLGGSAIREYYITTEAYMHSGIASYALATGNQPFAATKYLIKEVEKSQSPQLYVVDIRMLIYDEYDDAAIRRVTDSMNYSWNRIELINVLLNRSEKGKEVINPTYLDHYLMFPMYHSQWEDALEVNKSDECVWMGYNIYDYIEPFDRLSMETLEAEPVAISNNNEQVLRDFLDYCKTVDSEVMFISVPSNYGSKEFGKMNYAKEIIEDAGYDVLDLNYYVDEMGIDYSHDFKDYYHVNVWGAVKFTDYISDYIMKRYEFSDCRNNEEYNVWEENYALFSEALRECK